MVRTKEELLEEVRALVADTTTDEAIAFIENLSDTVDAAADPEDWKTRYEENDRAWREKYRDRFYSGGEDPEEVEEVIEEDETEEVKTKFEDLFKTED